MDSVVPGANGGAAGGASAGAGTDAAGTGGGPGDAGHELAPELDAAATFVLTVTRARKLRSTDFNGVADPYAAVHVFSTKSDAAREALVAALGEAEAQRKAAEEAVKTSGHTDETHDLASMLLGGEPSRAAVTSALNLLFKSRLIGGKWTGKSTGRTPVKPKTLTPYWGTRFEVPCKVRDVLVVQVWDEDRFGRGDFMGAAVVLPEWFLLPRAKSGSEIVAGLGRIGWGLTQPRAAWFQLCSRRFRGSAVGEVQLQGRISKFASGAGRMTRRPSMARPRSTSRAGLVPEVAAVLGGMRGVEIDVPSPRSGTKGGGTHEHGTPVAAAGGSEPSEGAADNLDSTTVAEALAAAAPAASTPAAAAAVSGSGGVVGGAPVEVPPLPERQYSEPGDAVGIKLLPHVHTKFCDRTFRVCTADGDLREGETVKVTLAVPTGIASCTWMRTSPGAAADSEFTPCGNTVDELARVSDDGHSDRGLALSSVTDALKYVSEAARKADARKGSRLLSARDVGCYIKAVVTPNGSPDPIESRPIGPVHPAPPNVRELWVRGDAKVGSTLRAELHYYGGSPGLCEYKWMHITSDGSRMDAGTAGPATPGTPIVDEAADPRCLVLTDAFLGSRVKCHCVAVRDDGERGQPSGTTSKPTRAVAAAEP